MKISTSTDPRGIGILALQHKDYDKPTGHPLGAWDLHHRASILAARVIDRNDTNAVGLGHWIYDPETVGDIHGAQLLKFDTRSVPMWRFATPVVVVLPESADVQTQSAYTIRHGSPVCSVLSGFSVNSIKDKEYKEDDRLKPFTPFIPKRNGKPLWPKFPVDFFGISLVSNKESDQEDLYFPTDPRLVAVNRNGDASMGTLVCDMGEEFKTAIDRTARLQSMMRVIKNPTQCGALELSPGSVDTVTRGPDTTYNNCIAWNIGPSGCGDTRGGYVFEKRVQAGGTPTPTGGGGGGGGVGNNDVATLDPAQVIKGQLGRLGNLPGGAIVVPDVFEVRQRALGLLGAGGGAAGGGGGGGGAGPLSPVVGQAPTPSSTGKGVIALVSHFDSGHTDVGSETDKHVLGKDADGHPINPTHLSTNSLFRRNDFYDAPLEFGNLYAQPERGRYIMPTYLRYDPQPKHPHVCGPKPGLWRWESECVAHIIDGGQQAIPPPLPPPPVATGPSGPPGGGTGGGGGGNPGVPGIVEVPTIPLRQWQPGRFDSYVAMETAFGVPAIIGRPQSLKTNTVDLRQARGFVPPGAQVESNTKTPAVYRLEAFGKQTAGEWNYTQNPSKSRNPGGTAQGGLVFMPPEFDITDNVDSFSRAASILPSTSTPYFIGTPGTYWGAGIPVPSTGGIKTGYSWGINTSGDLLYAAVDASGTATTTLKLMSDGDVQINRVLDGIGMRPIGSVRKSVTSTSNTGTSEETLKTTTFAANYFTDTTNNTNRGIRIKVFGTTAANGNAKTLRLYFGSTVVATNDVTSSPNGVAWELDAIVFATSGSTQRAIGESVVGSIQQSKSYTTPGETTSGTITVKMTAECPTASGDVTATGYIIEVIP